MATNQTQKLKKRVSRSAIRRAVASSTAIETGQSVTALEKKLRTGLSRHHHLKLATTRSR